MLSFVLGYFLMVGIVFLKGEGKGGAEKDSGGTRRYISEEYRPQKPAT